MPKRVVHVSAVFAVVVAGTVLSADRRDAAAESSPAYVSIGAASAVVAEAATAVTLTIRRDDEDLARLDTTGVMVDYTTLDGTAQQHSDFLPSAGTVEIGPGVTSIDVTIELRDDTIAESPEYFSVVLSNLVGAEPGPEYSSQTFVVHIVDDDAIAVIQISDQIVDEGGPGVETPITFEVTMSGPASTAVSTTVSVEAHDFGYFVDYGGGPFDIQFEPGEVTKYVTFTVFGDSGDEDDESFTVTATEHDPFVAVVGGPGTGTIVDDDPPPHLVMSRHSISEHAAAANSFFAITLLETSGRPVEVDYATRPDSATGADFIATSGTVTFLEGQTSKYIPVVIVDDELLEPDERFFIDISNAHDATIVEATGIVTIVDDDAALAVTGTPPTGTQGVNYEFAFTITGGPPPVVTRVAGSLPPGLTLNSAGRLSGVPTTTGTYQFTIAAANGVAPTALLTTAITILPRLVPPNVSGRPPSANVFQHYDFALTTSGSPAPALIANGLPLGLTMTPAGRITGVPLTAGTWGFQVRAANGVAPAFIGTFTIVVGPPGRANLVVSLRAPTSTAWDTPYDVTFTVTNLGPSTTFEATALLYLDGRTTVMSASPAPSDPSRPRLPIWRLGTMQPGETRTFIVKLTSTFVRAESVRLMLLASSLTPDPAGTDNVANAYLSVT